MGNNIKPQIYKGMIQYILDTTNYSLKSIAFMSNASIKQIKLIYIHEQIPPHLEKFELYLVRLYQIILEINIDKYQSPTRSLENMYENFQYK